MLKTLSLTPAAAVVALPAALLAISVYEDPDAAVSLGVDSSVLVSAVVGAVVSSVVDAGSEGFRSDMMGVLVYLDVSVVF